MKTFNSLNEYLAGRRFLAGLIGNEFEECVQKIITFENQNQYLFVPNYKKEHRFYFRAMNKDRHPVTFEKLDTE